jgi:four helix bundle protein
MYIQSFKQLIVWQKSIQLAKEIYKATESFPKSEMYGLTSQMRRCSVSIPSNIAEGKKRGTKKDFAQFLRIADGSAAELETQITIAEAIYPKISFSSATALLQEVQKMLITIIKSLQDSSPRS